MATIYELVFGRPTERLTKNAGRMAFGLAGFILASLFGSHLLPSGMQDMLKTSDLAPGRVLLPVLGRLYLLGGAGVLAGAAVGWGVDIVSPRWLRLWLVRSVRLTGLALSGFLAVFCLYALLRGHTPLSIFATGAIAFLGFFGVVFLKP
jgi:hypothetical protein